MLVLHEQIALVSGATRRVGHGVAVGFAFANVFAAAQMVAQAFVPSR